MKLTRSILLSALLIGSSSVAFASDAVESDMAKPNPVRKMGFKKASPDQIAALTANANKRLRAAAPIPKNLPPEWDLGKFSPDVYDQGDLGSCTANAISMQFWMDQIIQYCFNSGKNYTEARLQKALKKIPNISRLFVYYEERRKEQAKGQNSVNEDNGAFITSGMEVMFEEGAPLERDWPYIISKFTKKPSAIAYARAKAQRDVDGLGNDFIAPHGAQYNLAELKWALLNYQVLVFGADLFPGFQSDQTASTGVVPMPKPGEESIGGHAMILIGYSDKLGCFIGQNSWGKSWGQNGRFFLPYAYVTPSLMSEVWKMGKVTQPAIPIQMSLFSGIPQLEDVVHNIGHNDNNSNNTAADKTEEKTDEAKE